MGAMTCDDNRFEAIAKAREMLVSGTNIEDSPDEMAVLDTILFRCWQMGWIDALDVNARLKAENAKLRELLEAILQCAGETKRDKGCDACPMYNEPWRNDGTWCLLRPTLSELGIEVPS